MKHKNGFIKSKFTIYELNLTHLRLDLRTFTLWVKMATHAPPLGVIHLASSDHVITFSFTGMYLYFGASWPHSYILHNDMNMWCIFF
jgi:hypothetical protein